MSVAARLNRRITQMAVGRHLPYRTVRVRLTLLYGGLFLVSGAALMAITYALLVNAGFVFTLSERREHPADHGTDRRFGPRTTARRLPGPRLDDAPLRPDDGVLAHALRSACASTASPDSPTPRASVPSNLGRIGEVSDRDGAILVFPATINMQSAAFTQAATACGFMPDASALTAQDNRRRTRTGQQLLIQSGIALAGMSLLSLALGWLMAGRVLQPLEDSYHAQRQFVANASHELRAPLTRLRALIEVALASPEANLASLRHAHERVLASEQHLEQLIDALLAAHARPSRARAPRAPRPRHPCLPGRARPRVTARGPRSRRSRNARPAPTAGDPRLLERLIANLIDNAIRHNTPGGRLEITTGTPRPPRLPVDREHRPDHSARTDPASLPTLPTPGRRPHPPQQRSRTGTLDRPSDRQRPPAELNAPRDRRADSPSTSHSRRSRQ